jgi:hypothetical protein
MAGIGTWSVWGTPGPPGDATRASGDALLAEGCPAPARLGIMYEQYGRPFYCGRKGISPLDAKAVQDCWGGHPGMAVFFRRRGLLHGDFKPENIFVVI